MTPSQSINLLVRDCHQNSIDHGFWTSQNIGEKGMLIVTEVAEYFEGYRKDLNDKPDEHCPEFKHGTIEKADMLIRIFDLAGWEGDTNLGEAVLAKMRFNASRPHMHGKKC